jgi:hypothetical protein
MQYVEKMMTIPVKRVFYEELRQAARQQGLTLSAWVRLTLRRELEKAKEIQRDESKVPTSN